MQDGALPQSVDRRHEDEDARVSRAVYYVMLAEQVMRRPLAWRRGEG
jgi:hypothetical protein